MNQIVLAEVIAAVEATPAEQLIRGELVNSDGCVCSLGAHAYDHYAPFREYVDRIRFDREAYLDGMFVNGYNGIRKSIEAAGDSLDADQFVDNVIEANDCASAYGLERDDDEQIINETPDQRKIAILAALRELQEAA